MIELVHAKITHTYAAARRLSGMPRGLCYVDIFIVSDLFEPPEEGRDVQFPRQPAILADCTIINIPIQYLRPAKLCHTRHFNSTPPLIFHKKAADNRDQTPQQMRIFLIMIAFIITLRETM